MSPELLPASMMLKASALRDAVKYDPDTGLFFKIKKSGALVMEASKTKDGYIKISIRGIQYNAHRLAWLYMTGSWPKLQIDHINGIRHDNRFENLRDVSVAVNAQNVRAARKDNKTSGLLGSCWDSSRGRWKAQIGANGKVRNLGNFDTAQEAHDAYIHAKRALHAGCTI